VNKSSIASEQTEKSKSLVPAPPSKSPPRRLFASQSFRSIARFPRPGIFTELITIATENDTENDTEKSSPPSEYHSPQPSSSSSVMNITNPNSAKYSQSHPLAVLEGASLEHDNNPQGFLLSEQQLSDLYKLQQQMNEHSDQINSDTLSEEQLIELQILYENMQQKLVFNNTDDAPSEMPNIQVHPSNAVIPTNVTNSLGPFEENRINQESLKYINMTQNLNVEIGQQLHSEQLLPIQNTSTQHREHITQPAPELLTYSSSQMPQMQPIWQAQQQYQWGQQNYQQPFLQHSTEISFQQSQKPFQQPTA
jgi:hypothetical protein